MRTVTYNSADTITPSEYVSFLRTCELGAMYPKKDFASRISRLLQRTDVVITARDDRRLVGVCFGITDYTYFLFLTDLGVSRGYERRGIGRALVERAHGAAGGADDITMVTWSNGKALPFYAAVGLKPQPGLVGCEGTDWEPLDADELPAAQEQADDWDGV